MNVEIIGDGEPEYAIVGLIHGDEPCGKEAIQRFKQSDFEPDTGVKLILANEEAYEQSERFLEDDLNRVFPGDKDSESHEKRLAADILSEVKGLKVLDFHSTRSYNGVFAAQTKLDEERLELVRSTGAEKVSYHVGMKGCLDSYAECVVVECGLQGSEEAADNAYNVLLNFLGAEGVIDYDFELSEPEIFRIFETVEKPNYRFLGENFKLIEDGEVYADQDDILLKAEESFYPVLMSTNGYETILGHKAEKVKAEDIF